MKKAAYTAGILGSILMAINGCNASSGAKVEGREEARAYCSSCHSFPEPTLLDSATWAQSMLPRMGAMLGHYSGELSRNVLLEEGPAGDRVEASGLYPLHPVIPTETWERIQSYYLRNAPRQAIPGKKWQVENTTVFRAIRPAFSLSPPSTTFLGHSNGGQLLLGDAITGSLYVLKSDLSLMGQARTGESPVWITEEASGYMVTVMGSFSPTDAVTGSVLWLPKGGGQTRILVEGLARPVHHDAADFNQDGLMDIVVCEFGKWTGKLSIHWGEPDGTFRTEELIRQTGATSTKVVDWNGDGLVDIVALFAQGNEGIVLLENTGKGSFKRTELKRFHPSMGSAYLNVEDVNQDGHFDLIYCAGDQADFAPIEKAYQGVYVWYGNAEGGVSDSLFLPLRGAYAAHVHDFNADGWLDVAAISFFPDYGESEGSSGFVLFEGTDAGFKATGFPEVESGRWIVMHPWDIDADGDVDLVLGSLTMEVPGREDLVGRWISGGIPFVVLENITQ